MRARVLALGCILLLSLLPLLPLTAATPPDPTADGFSVRLAPGAGLGDTTFQRDAWGDVPVVLVALSGSTAWRPVTAEGRLLVDVDGARVAEVPFAASWRGEVRATIPGNALPAAARFTVCAEATFGGVLHVSCHHAAKNRLLDAGRYEDAERLDATPGVNVMTF